MMIRSMRRFSPQFTLNLLSNKSLIIAEIVGIMQKNWIESRFSLVVEGQFREIACCEQDKKKISLLLFLANQ